MRDRYQCSDDSTSSDSIQRPSQRRRLSIDSHLQLANDIQYRLALERIEVLWRINKTNHSTSSFHAVFECITAEVTYWHLNCTPRDTVCQADSSLSPGQFNQVSFCSLRMLLFRYEEQSCCG